MHTGPRGPMPPIRDVTGALPEGKNVMLTLSCGHTKLHRGKGKQPKRSHCMTCEDLPE